MKIIKDKDLPQGSQEWLDVRSKCGMASEVGALLGVSKWEPKTPLGLYKIKTGEIKIETNFAMEHGNKYEDEAREMFEDEMGAQWEPVVILTEDESVPMGASLDGWRKDDNTILEIKCPLKGVTSDLWIEVSETGRMPEQYWLQCQQQMLVAGATKLYFWVYDVKNTSGLLQVVKADKKAQDSITGAWTKYWAQQPPKALKEDVLAVDDEAWLVKARQWREVKSELDGLASTEKLLREDLINISKGQSCIGGGVQLKHSEAKGRVNYSKIRELTNVNLEEYRGEPTVKHYLRVT
jgi:putative phage-type endonuclease